MTVLVRHITDKRPVNVYCDAIRVSYDKEYFSVTYESWGFFQVTKEETINYNRCEWQWKMKWGIKWR